MDKTKKLVSIVIGIVLFIGIIFRLYCGIFVIQPIGALPEGATIVYWRSSVDLPFIASADGILDKSGNGVSILGRLSILSKVALPLKDHQIFRFGYSQKLYLMSTDGKQYNN